MRTPHRTPALLATLTFAVTLLTACDIQTGDGDPLTPPDDTTTPAEQPTVTPPNPVDLIRKAGATPEPGAETGVNDFAGGRFATGSWPGTGQEITVHTFPDPTNDVTAGLTTDDIHKYICGDNFTAVLVSAQGFDAAPPDVVAERLGGKVCR